MFAGVSYEFLYSGMFSTGGAIGRASDEATFQVFRTGVMVGGVSSEFIFRACFLPVWCSGGVPVKLLASMFSYRCDARGGFLWLSFREHVYYRFEGLL